MPQLIVVGGGELGRVIIEAARAQNFDIVSFVDPLPCVETTKRLGVSRLGTDSDLLSFPNALLVLGLGCISVNPVRQKVVEKIGAPPER